MRRRSERAIVRSVATAAFALAIGACLFAPRCALAQDGVHGQLDGDLDISAALGAAFQVGAPSLAARVSSLFLSSAGIYVGYADALGQDAARFDRSLAVGVSIKPVFWGRFAKVLSTGSPRGDLFFDSICFDFGAFFAAPHGGEIQSAPGFEAAMGLGVPLFASATGPFIEVRGAFRLSRADLAGQTPPDPIERGAMLSISIAWHHIVAVHIVDAGDRVLR